MQIVIDIPDWVYKHIGQGNEEAPDENISIDAIRNGTPLPKNHGRLIDETVLLKKYEDYATSGYAESAVDCTSFYEQICRTPTIIEGTEVKNADFD